ncbi:mitochondrial import receptor subunit TOM7 homolog [Cloeon dipterum]
MEPGTKQRLAKVSALARTVFHWGFIPTVLYLGFRKGADPGMPPLTIFSLLWQ